MVKTQTVIGKSIYSRLLFISHHNQVIQIIHSAIHSGVCLCFNNMQNRGHKIK